MLTLKVGYNDLVYIVEHDSSKFLTLETVVDRKLEKLAGSPRS